jgi:CRP-like cAMP-binding protein
MGHGRRLSFLQEIPLLAGMDEAELERLVADLKPQHLEAGQTIFFQGDRGDALYIIESGRVRIYVLAEDGQEVSVNLCNRGDLFGEMALIDQQPRSATAVAMEDTELLVLSSIHFYHHLRESYQLALNIMSTLSVRLRATTQEVQTLTSLDVSERIVRKLLQLAQRQGTSTQEGIRIRGRLTQTELASLISASRESTNRAMRALVRRGLIDVRHGRIILLEPKELAKMIRE